MTWKEKFADLERIYSHNQLAIILGASHGAVMSRLSSFAKTSFEDKIYEVWGEIKDGKDPRKILFDAWSERYIRNFNALVCRRLREKFNITVQDLAPLVWNSKNCWTNFSPYERGINIMPESLFRKIVDSIEKIEKIDISMEKEKLLKIAKSFELEEQRQVIHFKKLNPEIPEIVELVPPSRNLEGIDHQFSVYENLKEKFKHVFLGARLLPKKFKGKRGVEIDILVISNGKIYAIEVKGWENVSRTARNGRLKRANYLLRNIREEFEGIDKTACIVPTLKLSNSFKRKFLLNGNFLFDKGEDISLDKSPYKHLPQSKHRSRREILKESKKLAFKDKEIVYFRNIRRELGLSLSDLLREIKLKSYYKTHLSGLETGRDYYPELRRKYIKLLRNKQVDKEKVLKGIKREKSRWRKVFKFPMAVSLAFPLEDDNLEKKVEEKLKEQGYLTVRNVFIDDKRLTKMTLNKRHPEIDILARKNGKVMGVSCKNGKNRRAKSQFSLLVKREIDKLSQWYQDMEFDEMMIAVSADLPSQTWRDLRRYADERSITFWRMK